MTPDDLAAEYLDAAIRMLTAVLEEARVEDPDTVPAIDRAMRDDGSMLQVIGTFVPSTRLALLAVDLVAKDGNSRRLFQAELQREVPR